MKHKFLILFFLTISLIFSPRLLFSSQHQATVQDLSQEKYFLPTLNAINNARESIFIALYFIIADPQDADDPVNQLLNALIQAKARGVDIKIILEDSKFKESHLSYKKLTQANIPVYLDTPTSLLHNKTIIIDRHITITGSPNWSRRALTDNQETAVLIESEDLAGELLNNLSRIITRDDTPVLPHKYKGIPISKNFLLSPQAGHTLVKNNAELAFNLYLSFLKEEVNPIPFDPQGLTRGQRKAILSLQNRYNLINYDTRNKRVLLLGIENRQTPYQKPQSDFFILPEGYWQYHLDKRLSLRAKFIYLVCLWEAEKSTKNPYWFRSQEDLSRFYSLSDYTISLGLKELERENLLEISRSISETHDFSDRLANIYCLNPLIPEEEYKARVTQLILTYGKALYHQAQKLSAQLNEPKDLGDIRTFIHLIQTHSYKKVKMANSITAKRKKGSGLYDISYTIDLLQK